MQEKFDADLLGTYSTKERALEILNYLYGNFAGKQNIPFPMPEK
jgi:hypothetical protein